MVTYQVVFSDCSIFHSADVSGIELDKMPMLEAVDDECEETDLSVDFSWIMISIVNTFHLL